MAVEGEKVSVLFVKLQNTPVSYRGAVLLGAHTSGVTWLAACRYECTSVNHLWDLRSNCLRGFPRHSRQKSAIKVRC